MIKKIYLLLIIITLQISCKKIMAPLPNNNEVLDGALEDLTLQEKKDFILGDKAFNNTIFTIQSGLGPLFIANSCGSCHAGDGKGHPFTNLIRFGQTDSNGNKYLTLGGPQLQHRAIPGYSPENVPNGVSYTTLIAPANSGLGFFDAMTDADIIAMADPYDSNGDGISGNVNWIKPPDYCELRPNSIFKGNKLIGRFGKKGATYDLLQQTANAYNQDMGITSSFEAYDTYSKLKQDPEVNTATIYHVVTYLKTLKAPPRRNETKSDVVIGKDLFVTTGCEKCHVSELKTGPSNINALNYKQFYPYTDLLLHNMGRALDDGYTEGSATTDEWKTPALWGLGLSKNSQGGKYYLMHDGRAHSIEEAILLHSGEAEKSKINYEKLERNEKQLLITFLESL